MTLPEDENFGAFNEAILTALEQNFTKQWLQESLEMMRAGIYEQLSRILNDTLPHKSTVLDIYSGLCPTEQILLALGKTAKVIGVEANETTAKLGVETLKSQGINVGLLKPSDVETQNNNHTVTIICDTLAASQKRLQLLLQGVKCDASIITFLGLSPRSMESLERRTGVNSSHTTDDVTLAHALQKIEAFEAATLHTKEGGHLLRAERDLLVDTRNPVLLYHATTHFHEQNRLLYPFWEVRIAGYLNERVEGKMIGGKQEVVIAKVLRRTSTPYDQKHFDSLIEKEADLTYL